MSFNFKTEEYYKRFIELQEKLRKSEEERLKLEMKFNEMVRVTREEEQMHFRKLRAQYKRFLEEDRRRQDRNERILRSLERIENRVTVLMAKTERFKLLRQQYQTYLDRIYLSNQSKKPDVPRVVIDEKPSRTDDKNDIVQSYIQNLSSHKLREMLKKEEEARARLPTADPDDRYNYPGFYNDNVESRPNYANTIADDIINSIYTRSSRLNDNSKLKQSREFNNNMPPDVSISQYENPQSTNYNRMSVFKDYSTDIPQDDSKKLTSETEDTETDDISESQEILYKNPEFHKSPIINDNSTLNDSLKFTNPLVTFSQNLQNKELPKESDKKHLLQPSIKTDEINLTTNKNISDDFILASQDDNISNSNLVNVTHPKELTENIQKHLENPLDEKVQQLDNEHKKIIDEKLSQSKWQEIMGKVASHNNTRRQRLESARNNLPSTELPSQTIVQEQLEQQQIVKNEELNVTPINNQDNIKQELGSEIISPTNANMHSELPNPEEEVLTQQYDEDVLSEKQYPKQTGDTGQNVAHYNENSQPVDQYDQQNEFADGQNSQQILQSEIVDQYDTNSQPVVQYDENDQPIQQTETVENYKNQLDQPYDQQGQPVQQFDEHGQPIQQYGQQQYDENGQLIPQFDESGQPIQQYDENGQPIQLYTDQQYEDQTQYQYDENGQIIGQYDESGQLVQGYDQSDQQYNQQYDGQQYNENGQIIQSYDYGDGQQQPQYDENDQLIQQSYDDQQYYNQPYEENINEDNQQYADNAPFPQDSVPETQQNIEEPPKASNVMEMLDTDTESLKQDTKISHDSDFDFSNA